MNKLVIVVAVAVLSLVAVPSVVANSNSHRVDAGKFVDRCDGAAPLPSEYDCGFGAHVKSGRTLTHKLKLHVRNPDQFRFEVDRVSGTADHNVIVKIDRSQRKAVISVSNAGDSSAYVRVWYGVRD